MDQSNDKEIIVISEVYSICKRFKKDRTCEGIVDDVSSPLRAGAEVTEDAPNATVPALSSQLLLIVSSSPDHDCSLCS